MHLLLYIYIIYLIQFLFHGFIWHTLEFLFILLYIYQEIFHTRDLGFYFIYILQLFDHYI